MASFRVNGLVAAPMTAIWLTGFEMGELVHDGFESHPPGTVIDATRYNASLRERLGEGSDPGRSGDPASVRTSFFRVSVREFVCGFAFHKWESSSFTVQFRFYNEARTDMGALMYFAGGSPRLFTVRRGNTNLVPADPDTSTGFRFIAHHMFIDSSRGFARVYVDNFEAGRRIALFTGNTANDANTWIAQLGMTRTTGSPHEDQLYDDIVVYARTLFFKDLNGPVIFRGQTVTDTSTGATAVVDAVELDKDDSTQGVVYISDVQGDFGANNPLLFQAGATATSVNAHPADIHGLVRPVYIRREKFVTTVHSGWTRSGGSSDHEAISDLPEDDNGLYLEATAPGALNRHGVDNAPPSNLYGGVEFVVVQAYAEQDGAGVGTLQLGVESSAETSLSGFLPVATAPSLIQGPAVMRDPDDGDPWKISATDAIIVSLESGA